MDNQFLATPVELTFGDKKYLMSPLTDRDQSELNQYVQSTYIDNARRSLPSDTDDKTYARLMTLALQTALGLQWTRKPGRDVFTTEEGLARLAWQGIKRNHKDVTHIDLIPLMNNKRYVMEFELKFLQLNSPPQSVVDYIKENQKGGEADAQSFQQEKNTPQLSELQAGL
jgi:hypothetical protein